jgi:hypothetical protein
MSSTRTTTDDSVFHQNRYASSAEFERGLVANMVAKRCSMLNDKADRDLIWFVQYLSHQDGGLAAVAKDLLARYPDRLGTYAMLEIGKKESQTYTAQEISQIRCELPKSFRSNFPLQGETQKQIRRLAEQYGPHASPEEIDETLSIQADNDLLQASEAEDYRPDNTAVEKEEAKKHPSSYPVSTFFDLCRRAAVDGVDSIQTHNLERELKEMCLNPEWNFAAGGPWYFADLVKVLREYQQHWIQQQSNVVMTALGKKICETLDYALYSHRLALLEGNARLGKSFAARAWCLQHPGKARFIEVPPSNDESTFYRALARGLGLGNFLSYKAVQIRERVESVLQTGDLILVLDEAQRLWPQRNFRYGFPNRIVWVMAMANAGVPICMVSTPQFITSQKAVEKTGWNSAQLTGRIGHYEFLPTALEASDLMAVSRAVLPEADDVVLQALADYASASSRYLAAVDSIAMRARYIAMRAGRSVCNTADVRTAMKESVIPSDTMLARTLDHAKETAGGRRTLVALAPVEPMPPVTDQIESPLPARGSRPAELPASLRRSRNAVDLAPV